MITFEITSVPISRLDTYNPFYTMLNTISKDFNDEYIEIRLENRLKKDKYTLKCNCKIDSENENYIIDELKRVGYTIKSGINFPLLETDVFIHRDLGISNKFSFSDIEYDENTIDALLSLINEIPNDTGIGIIIKSEKKVREKIIENINENAVENNKFLYNLRLKQSLFKFVIYTIADDTERRLQIGYRLFPLIKGLKLYKSEEKFKTSLNFSSELGTYWKMWKRELATMASYEELGLFANILSRLDKTDFPINKDTIIQNASYGKDESIDIVFGGKFSDGRLVGVSKEHMCQHVFITGSTGAGKGNLIINLAKQLKENEISFLIIESAKKELHHLGKWIEDLKVWRPEAGNFVLNPFSIPDGVDYETYRPIFKSIMDMVFDMYFEGSPLPAMFTNTLSNCFKHYVNVSGCDVKAFGINEFISEFRNHVENSGYGDTQKKNVKQSGTNRLREPIEDGGPFIFDSISSIPIKELVNGYNVLQIDNLGSDISKQRFASLLLTQIIAYIKNYNSSKKLKFVILLDESHNLLVDKKNNAKFSFTSDFAKMLHEVRSKGISIIVADQSMHNVPEVISKACDLKIFLGSDRDSGIMDYSAQIHLDDIGLSYLNKMEKGDGILLANEFNTGIPFHTKNYIDDLKINEEYECENKFYNSRITVETYRECYNCNSKGTCLIENKKRAYYAKEELYDYNIFDKHLKEYDTKNHYIDLTTINSEKDFINELLGYKPDFDKTSYNCLLQQLFREYKRDAGNITKDFQSLIASLSSIREKINATQELLSDFSDIYTYLNEFEVISNEIDINKFSEKDDFIIDLINYNDELDNISYYFWIYHLFSEYIENVENFYDSLSNISSIREDVLDYYTANKKIVIDFISACRSNDRNIKKIASNNFINSLFFYQNKLDFKSYIYFIKSIFHRYKREYGRSGEVYTKIINNLIEKKKSLTS